MAKHHSILIATKDPYLAGIYGRKFELDHWDVSIAETIQELEIIASQKRPNIILLSDDMVQDIAGEVQRLRTLPTILSSKLVILAEVGDVDVVQKALESGSADYLIHGHFVPQEAVEKMRNLLEA